MNALVVRLVSVVEDQKFPADVDGKLESMVALPPLIVSVSVSENVSLILGSLHSSKPASVSASHIAMAASQSIVDPSWGCSHISPVTLSVTVPSPLSVNDCASGFCEKSTGAFLCLL